MKCFYHNDLDGHCAGSLVAKYENNYNIDDYIEVDYLMDLPIEEIKDGEKIYFVDYSFTESTVHYLISLKSKGCDIIWIDHHSSSLKLENNEKYPWLKNINGIRNDLYSGAMLTYFYLFLEGQFNPDVLNSMAPKYICYVDDYDCWKYNYKDYTNYFKLGMESSNWDVLNNTWINLFEEEIKGDNNLLNQILDKGKIIKNYIDKDNEYYRNNFAYESEINGLKCLVVNKKTNSWVFGERYNKYPLVMVWVYNGEQYSYSIFSSNPNVDCAEIAESYGGGGHKGAAGFALSNMPFVKI